MLWVVEVVVDHDNHMVTLVLVVVEAAQHMELLQ
jgi:hypothetical protein